MRGVIGRGRTHDWDFHCKVEREFELAANLADLDVPDIGPDGFKIVYSSRPSVDWKKRLEIEHKELGFDVPSSLSLNSKRLRAMVHHHYSSHLLSQTHREFDALKHENLVIELLPEFGEAVINCAQACIQIGDSKRALNYIEQAERMRPAYLDSGRFEFVLSQCRAQALEGIGDLDGAREELRRCIVLAQKSNFSQDAATLERILQNTEMA